MTKLTPGVSEKREPSYVKAMTRLFHLRGLKYLNELFAYDPNDPNNPKLHFKGGGLPKGRKPGMPRHRRDIIRKSRRRNRTR